MGKIEKFFLGIILLIIMVTIGLLFYPKPDLKPKDISKEWVTLGDGKVYELSLVLNALIQNQLLIQSKLSTSTN